MHIKSIILTEDNDDNKDNCNKNFLKILGEPLSFYCKKALEEVEDNNIYLMSSIYDTPDIVNFINDTDNVIILYDRSPLIRGSTIRKALDFHKEVCNDVTVITGYSSNFKNYTSMIKESDGRIVGIQDTAKAKGKIQVNSDIYIFNGKLYKDEVLKNRDNKNLALVDLTAKLLREDLKISAFKVQDSTDIIKINSNRQLAQCIKLIKERINNNHMDNGVIIEDPSNTYIGPNVIIGSDTTIEPNCMLKGNTQIGSSCLIGHNSNIDNSKISNGVKIENSVIRQSVICDNSYIGPFAYIRPQSRIGKGVRIGDFVEIKNSKIGDYTKVSHHTYVGDADVGEHVNFGCGSILVNYDSVNKHRSNIEDHAFIGCNTKIVSPVNIGEGAYTAAGSTITKDVPDGSLGIARSRQENKEGWVANRFQRK